MFPPLVKPKRSYSVLLPAATPSGDVMPFEQTTPRPFTLRGVEFYAPAVPGVYGISNSRQWIFIGQADDIRSALLGLLTSTMGQNSPAGFVYEQCDASARQVRETRLIREYGPVMNRNGFENGSMRPGAYPGTK